MSLHEEWLAIDRQFEAPVEKVNLRLYQLNAVDQIDGAIARGARRIMVQAAVRRI